MDFAEEITRGAQLFEAGNFADAATVFKQLCENEQLARTARSIAAINLAVTYDKMGHPEHAVAAHEYGVGIAVGDYLFAQENRAAFLVKIGRYDDAIGVWEHLLSLDFLAPEKSEQIRKNLDVTLSKRREEQ